MSGPAGSGKDPRIGQLLGGDRYEILNLFGDGGMGRVYRARQHSVDRFVAVKFLLDQWEDNAEIRERFVREAKLVAGLRDPNCITVHDYGEAEDGSPYMVLELLKGKSLGVVQDGLRGRRGVPG